MKVSDDSSSELPKVISHDVLLKGIVELLLVSVESISGVAQMVGDISFDNVAPRMLEEVSVDTVAEHIIPEVSSAVLVQGTVASMLATEDWTVILSSLTKEVESPEGMEVSDDSSAELAKHRSSLYFLIKLWRFFFSNFSEIKDYSIVKEHIHCINVEFIQVMNIPCILKLIKRKCHCNFH